MGLGIGRIFYYPWVDTGRPDVHVLIFGMEQPIWSNVTSCFQIRHAMFLGSVTLFLSRVLDDVLEKIKESRLILSSTILFCSLFSNNLTTPQLCVTHLQDSPYSQQGKRSIYLLFTERQK